MGKFCRFGELAGAVLERCNGRGLWTDTVLGDGALLFPAVLGNNDKDTEGDFG